MPEAENDLEAMQRWLALGLGRAVLHLELHDSAPYHAMILHACLYQEPYDSQTEPERAHYLDDILLASGQEAYFRSRILAALVDPVDELNLDQLCGLLVEWARRGDAEARQVLYTIAGDLADAGISYPNYRLIELDGWEGFVFVAERLGAAILNGAEGVHDDALDDIKHHMGEDAVAARLAELRASNHLIAVYLDTIDTNTIQL